MAGTIVTTPAIGASDWTDWITQQGLTDTGYMRVSLTNFSGTAASSIATGSVMECAGSIYSFTETAISLATGTASANVAVYFHVIPSAGGTTCTIEMDSTAPTWVDAKQGFYASAASLTRVIGGCYIGTAATYYSKYLYTPEIVNNCLSINSTRPILKYQEEIGEWNMGSTAYVEITKADLGGNIHITRIRDIHVLIRQDDDSQRKPLVQVIGGGTANTGGWWVIESTDIRLYRITGGAYDGANFNATASTLANRGWITIFYEA